MPQVNYFRWHNAIYNHFFGNGTGDVTLYVTPEIIDQIGESLGEGWNFEHFQQSVLFDRNSAIVFMFNRYGVRNSIPTRVNNVLQFSRVLTEQQYSREGISAPFLNYLILFICLASQANLNNDGGGIRKTIRQTIGRAVDNDFGIIKTLFNTLEQREPRFQNGRLNNYPYVGLLRYQLIINPTIERQLKQTLQRYNFIFDEEVPFKTIKSRIYNYVNNDIRDLLDRAVNDEACKRRVEDIVYSVEPGNNEETNDQEENTNVKRSLVRAFLFNDDENKVVYFTDWQPTNFKHDDWNLNQKPYLNNPQNNRQIEFDDEQTIRLETVRLEVANRRPDIVFLCKYELDDMLYYIETINVTQNEDFYIAVRRASNQYNQIVEYLRANTQGLEPCDIQVDSIAGFNPQNWDLFFAEKVTEEYGTTERIENNTTGIRLSGGIRCNRNTNNVYLPLALPYIESTQTDLTVRTVEINNTLRREGTDYRIIRKGTKIIFDLVNPYIIQDGTYKVKISVSNRDGYTTTFTFYLSNPTEYVDPTVIYKIDAWGRLSTNNEDNTLMRGNDIPNVRITPYQTLAAQIPMRPFEDDTFQAYFFINLLASCCSRAENHIIDRSYFDRCVRYTATRNNFALNNDLSKELRKKLVDYGIMVVNYDNNQTIYQAIPPTFVLLPSELNNSSRRYLLTGCMSRHFLANLQRYCLNDNGGTMNVVDTEISDPFIPSPILLSDGFDPDAFLQQYPHYCQIKNGDLATQMLNYSATLSDYAQDIARQVQDNLTIDPGRVTRLTDQGLYPGICESLLATRRGTKNRYIEIDENRFILPRVNVWSWLDMFHFHMQNRPFYLTTPNAIWIPENIYLPSLLKRALYLRNNGIPNKKNVFICYNQITKDPLYTSVLHYQCLFNDNAFIARFNEIINGSNGQSLCQTGRENNNIINNIDIQAHLWKVKPGYEVSVKHRNLLHITIGDVEWFATSSMLVTSRHENGHEQWMSVNLNGYTINHWVSRLILNDDLIEFLIENTTFITPIEEHYNKEELTIIR